MNEITLNRVSTPNDKSQQDNIGVLQIPSYPGRLTQSVEEVREGYKMACEAGANIVIAPEGVIGSYMSMDGFYDPDYRKSIQEATEEVVSFVGDIPLVFGSFMEDPLTKLPGNRPALNNVAFTAHRQDIVGASKKTHLPNYSVFDDQRWFRPGTIEELSSVNIDGQFTLGVHVCEDLWEKHLYGSDIVQRLVETGADVLINTSASPFEPGKLRTRIELAQAEARLHGKPFAYANQIGCYDGCEGLIPFDGQSFVLNREGGLVGAANRFAREVFIADMNSPNCIEIPQTDHIQEIHEALVHGIREYFKFKGNAPAVIGISGGIDSALVAALAVEALGPDRVVGVTLPTRFNSKDTISDAHQVAKNLGIPRNNFHEIPIGDIVDLNLKTFSAVQHLDQMPIGTSEENVQARERMICIMYIANRVNGIALNTGNRTELVLDNMTIYGDMMGGVSVLGGVDKDYVYALSNYINIKAGMELIPQTTIDRIASAELKDGQDDSMVMGDKPEVLAPMVRDILNGRLNPRQTKDRWSSRFSEELIDSIFKKLFRSQWKMYQAAPPIRIDQGRAHDRRFPMDWFVAE